MTVIVLTGCSSGLGARVLAQLVRHLPSGATILSGYRSTSPPPSPPGLSDGSTLAWIPLDLASLASVDQFVRQVETKLGSNSSIDCVLLNAATWNNSYRPTKVDDAEWSQEFVVNHLAQHRLVEGLLPLLSAGSRGRIVFTSSSLQNSLPREVESIEQVVSILRDPNDKSSTARSRYASSKILQSLSYFHLAHHAQHLDIVGVSPGFVPTTGLSRDAPWWQQLLMKWVVYYLPFCSSEEQGTRKILECLNYFLPSRPFPSNLDEQLPTSIPREPSTTSHSVASSRLVFHPPSLSPLESKSSAPVYSELRELLGGIGRDPGAGKDDDQWNGLSETIMGRRRER